MPYAISYYFYLVLTMYFYGDQLYQVRNAKSAGLYKREMIHHIIL